MGRTLKRVALDFDWPLDKIWEGYINPYYEQTRKCHSCDGEGYNPETKEISDNFYFGDHWCNSVTQDEVDALIAANRLWDYWRKVGPDGWEDIVPRPKVTAEQVNAKQGPGFGFDAIDRWVLIETRAKRLGVYGLCSQCEGHCIIWPSEEVKKLSEAWEPTDPPEGPGYQLWENTSEGSPQSPVFKTLEELCLWASTNATTFADCKATKGEWMAMLMGGNVHHRSGNMLFL